MANYDASYLWPVQQEELAASEIYASLSMAHRRDAPVVGLEGEARNHTQLSFSGNLDSDLSSDFSLVTYLLSDLD